MAGLERKLSGWGGNDAPDLTPEQATGVQVHEEPVARADFGEQLTGDLGRPGVADKSAEAPETIEPDTRLGRRPD